MDEEDGFDELDDLIDPVARKIFFEYTFPFHLSMNAGGMQPAETLGALGLEADPASILSMLKDSWHERNVAAWLAMMRKEPEVTAAVLESLRTCWGSLCAPDLAVAAIVLAGAAAESVLRAYQAEDLRERYGSASFISAVLEHLALPAGEASATERDREELRRMLALARRVRAVTLRSTFTTKADVVFPVEDRGIDWTLPSGTRSVVIQQDPKYRRTEVIGVRVSTPDGSELAPGSEVRGATLQFWTPGVKAQLRGLRQLRLTYLNEQAVAQVKL